MSRSVSVVVADNVGKTSLINSLLTESFNDNLPAVLSNVTIPSKYNPDNVDVEILDTNGAEFADEALANASVVILVYSVVEQFSYDQIIRQWLPHITEVNPSAPIVVVGNKIDIRGEIFDDSEMEARIAPIMKEFKQVETCIESSAKQMVNIAEIFYFALKSVLYPTSTLYDSSIHALQPKCLRALRRIFFLSDADMDGYLSDQDLNLFQEAVFGQQLSREEITSIKDCIQSGCEDGFVPGKGVTEKGFVFLNQLFIQRGRLETTWAVLKHFDFDESLDMSIDYSSLKSDVEIGIVAQLSPEAGSFLISLFVRLDRDIDGSLSEAEMSILFDLLPANPWETYSFPDNVELDSKGYVTLKGFLGQWHAFALSDPMQCLYTLKYLGFKPIQSAFVHVKAGKLEQYHNRTKRTIFRCLVIGDEGCGKTALLRSMIRKNFSDSYLPTDEDFSCVVVNGEYKLKDKYIMFEEYGPNNDVESLLESGELKNQVVDLICLVFDIADPDSLQYLKNLRDRHEIIRNMPTLVVAAKCDLLSSISGHAVEEYCQLEQLPQCVYTSVKNGLSTDIVNIVLCAAIEPQMVLPSLRTRTRNARIVRLGFLTAALAAATAAGFWWYRLNRRQQK